MILESALLCLSFAIYFESRNEPIKPRTAIAEVVMYRAKGDQNNICKEFYRKGAFGRGKSSEKNSAHFLKTVKSHKQPGDRKAWVEINELSRNIILGRYKRVLPKKASHFYNPKIDPRPKWATKENYVATVGSHKYYHVK